MLTCRIEFGGPWGVCVFHFCKLDENLWLFSNAILQPHSAGPVRCIRLEIDMSNRGLHFSKGIPKAPLIHHGTPGHALSHLCCRFIRAQQTQQQQFPRKRIYAIDPTATSTSTPTHTQDTGQVLGSLLRVFFYFSWDYFCKLFCSPPNKFKQIEELGSPWWPLNELSWAEHVLPGPTEECQMCSM